MIRDWFKSKKRLIAEVQGLRASNAALRELADYLETFRSVDQVDIERKIGRAFVAVITSNLRKMI